MGKWMESTGNIWKPKQKEDSVCGLLVSKEENVGDNNSRMYHIEDSETHTVHKVWGSAILDDRMIPVKVGQEVKITYKGLGEASKGKNPPKIFKVEYRDPESLIDQDIEESIGDIKA
jgi:hypothetical protein